jgi:tetratricopeptide (TPR) repeat protein
VEQRPLILWLDRGGEVFGRFFAAARWPRRAAVARGFELARSGALDEAEAVWLAAFDEPVVTADEQLLGPDLDVEASGRVLDISLHTALARLYLDQGRLSDAAERIGLARERMQRDDRWLFEHEVLALEARLAIRSGRPEQALRELRQAVERAPEVASTEVAALLAVASHLAGQPADWTAACRDARSRGVDLRPLQCPVE